MPQERKRRPGAGDKGDGGQSADNIVMTPPPVGDISEKLAEALKQEQDDGCCPSGCWCKPCMACNCGQCDVDSGRISRDEAYRQAHRGR